MIVEVLSSSMLSMMSLSAWLSLLLLLSLWSLLGSSLFQYL
jgi:hypothetical protein